MMDNKLKALMQVLLGGSTLVGAGIALWNLRQLQKG
jgi:hypothetical protein